MWLKNSEAKGRKIVISTRALPSVMALSHHPKTDRDFAHGILGEFPNVVVSS